MYICIYTCNELLADKVLPLSLYEWKLKKKKKKGEEEEKKRNRDVRLTYEETSARFPYLFLFERWHQRIPLSTRPRPFCFPLCISSFSKPDADADRFPIVECGIHECGQFFSILIIIIIIISLPPEQRD